MYDVERAIESSFELVKLIGLISSLIFLMKVVVLIYLWNLQKVHFCLNCWYLNIEPLNTNFFLSKVNALNNVVTQCQPSFTKHIIQNFY